MQAKSQQWQHFPLLRTVIAIVLSATAVVIIIDIGSMIVYYLNITNEKGTLQERYLRSLFYF